jgi:hypothetical protein
MNNEQYKQIIDEAYNVYLSITPSGHVVGNDSDPLGKLMLYKGQRCHLSGYAILERFTKEEFLNKCKTDQEFSERFAIKIEERELSLEEREKIATELYPQLNETSDDALINSRPFFNEFADSINIPTKQITLTYQKKKLEVYE